MTIPLVAPTEPADLVALGVSSSVPEQYGSDIIVPAEGYLIGIQRKKFPEDFFGSLADGRLATSLTKIMKLRVRILILEGRAHWATGGALLNHPYGQGKTFTKASLNGMLFSAQIERGISTYWTESVPDTCDFIRDLVSWAEKSKHTSLSHRPKPVQGEWERDYGARDEAVHLLQGFDGIGPQLAGDMFDHFGRVPLRWDVTEAEMLEVRGLGKGRVKKLTSTVAPKEAEDE